ncbi:Lrp/AsnC family transcriptional regulator [Segnochrobactrum spirostomi]|uniref:Lrp/AsnC family transcriptional regulator n=1 Tax=Segnochrobactrum spirostomi TaxID=2608987 RepID=A0A6A7Y4F7_9HYPH|nr:Lrp/AsnC family transcriptional regulator [Segnochrobactrum spirostomi]MQT12589.1 Lrp/AsnC family transcriptional regulator [Segnochrobactrum spirostomi]
MNELDETDRRLIALLQENGRMPTASLAAVLGVSRGTVQNRIARLQAAKVLVGFTVRLGQEVSDEAVRAITSIAIEGDQTSRIVAALARMPEITRLHSTNGRWDLVVEITAADLGHIDRVLREIRSLKGIAGSETSLLLSRYK